MAEFQMGRWLEDFTAGEVIRHRPGRTILESDNTLFSLLTNNPHPLHTDHHYASKTGFGRPLVNSCLTFAVVTGMSVAGTSLRAVANLGWDRVRVPHPVFAGDTLYAESTVLEVRPSRSQPDCGVVTIETHAFNQRGELVMEFCRTFLVAKRGSGAIPDFDEVPLDGE